MAVAHGKNLVTLTAANDADTRDLLVSKLLLLGTGVGIITLEDGAGVEFFSRTMAADDAISIDFAKPQDFQGGITATACTAAKVVIFLS